MIYAHFICNIGFLFFLEGGWYGCDTIRSWCYCTLFSACHFSHAHTKGEKTWSCVSITGLTGFDGFNVLRRQREREKWGNERWMELEKKISPSWEEAHWKKFETKDGKRIGGNISSGIWVVCNPACDIYCITYCIIGRVRWHEFVFAGHWHVAL